jgi:hypothetical protein
VETVILEAVDPFDQVLPVDWEEVKITDPPSQKVVAPFGVMTGTVGVLLTTIVTGADSAEQVPLEEVTV